MINHEQILFSNYSGLRPFIGIQTYAIFSLTYAVNCTFKSNKSLGNQKCSCRHHVDLQIIDFSFSLKTFANFERQFTI